MVLILISAYAAGVVFTGIYSAYHYEIGRRTHVAKNGNDSEYYESGWHYAGPLLWPILAPCMAIFAFIYGGVKSFKFLGAKAVDIFHKETTAPKQIAGKSTPQSELSERIVELENQVKLYEEKFDYRRP